MRVDLEFLNKIGVLLNEYALEEIFLERIMNQVEKNLDEAFSDKRLDEYINEKEEFFYEICSNITFDVHINIESLEED